MYICYYYVIVIFNLFKLLLIYNLFIFIILILITFNSIIEISFKIWSFIDILFITVSLIEK